MMIKITERCTMGCKHCMNDAKPDGSDMTLDVLEDTLNFMKKHNIGRNLIITGGEPLEHRTFDAVMGFICGWNDGYIQMITITTNGEQIAQNYEKYQKYIEIFKDVGIILMYQISADTRYYPRRIPTHKRVFREPGFFLCDDCVAQVYPQGRAKDNNLPWQANASKCYNVRAIAAQMKECTLSNIENTLAASMKFCTPHIKIDGTIGLGESDLCPPCGSIYDTEEEIMSKIRNFRCEGCRFILDTLPEPLRKLIE